MYRLLVLYPPPNDPAAFRAYYEGTHLPLAGAAPERIRLRGRRPWPGLSLLLHLAGGFRQPGCHAGGDAVGGR